MASTSKTCYLRCVENLNIKINLGHQEAVTVGRGPTTAIKDTLISRNQLIVNADLDKNQVEVTRKGKAISGCNGFALKKDTTYFLRHGDVLEVRLGVHKYEIVFDPPCAEEVEEVLPKKLKFSGADDMKVGQDDFEVGRWEEVLNKHLLIYTCNGVKSSPNIAGFDMDGTLIKTKSGACFAKNRDDWTLNFGNVVSKLKEYLAKNYKLVVFTNQAGLGRDSSKIKEFKEKVQNLLLHLKVPMQVFVATERNIYRKPLTGMWNVLKDEKNSGTEINLDDSFYVGDAAGREKNWAPKKNKDHSLADRLFALNIGINFFTPEEFFLGARTVPYKMPEFDPKSLTVSSFSVKPGEDQEVIMMVGAPGSGKSTVCKTYLLPLGYVHINRDKLGSWQKCVKILEESLQGKKNVVIDNTNPSKEVRKKYLDVTKKYHVGCRCFVMATSVKHAKHNNKFRDLTNKSHKSVSDIVINSYGKQFEQPMVSEGFSEIVNVPFVPFFDNKEQEKLYYMFLLEN